MAKQNFIAGGYVGKLGETVGQRWKNKRTVRVYVIPHNPRTPNQQKWRGRFRDAVPYAQIGMTFNAKAPCWENASLTEWQQRMSVAKTNVDNGISGWQCIPIFPKGYTPSEQATSVTMEVQGSNVYTIIPRGAGTVETGRIFTLLLHCENTETGEWEDLTAEGIAGRTKEGGIDVEIPGHTLSFGDMVMAVTCDDSEHDNKMYYIPPMELVADNSVIVDTWIVDIETGTGNLRMFAPELIDIGIDTSFQFNMTVRDVLTGELVELSSVLNIPAITGVIKKVQNYPWYGFMDGTKFGANGRHLTVGGVDYIFPTVGAEFLTKEKYPLGVSMPGATTSFSLIVDEGGGETRFTAVWRIPENINIDKLKDGTTDTQTATVSFLSGGSRITETVDLEDFSYDTGIGFQYFTWEMGGVQAIPDTDAKANVTVTLTVEGTYAIFTRSYDVTPSIER